MNFIEATNSTNPYHSIFLTPEQERWLDFQKMIASAKTDFTSYLLPKNKYRIKINDIINHQKFEIFIMTCIVLNIVTMALTYEGSPASYDTVLENINYFFTSVFILECIMKFVGLGVRAFWYSGWNRFDLFVVISSIIDILMSTIGTSLFSFLRVGPQLARILRVMRVSRLLKLIKSLKGIQKLLETLSLALPSLLNVGALLMLAYFIFAVLGVFLFKDIKKGKIIDEYNNFGNFHNAMILLFSCSTGESWWSFMFDTLKETPYAPLYWIPFIVMCSFIMLNLFILVILDEFEKYNKKGDSPSSLFKEGVVEFRKNWSALTRNTKGTRMPSRLLIDFFKLLNPELGFGPAARRELVAKEIMKMNITGDENNNVYFNEVLFGALKRTYGNLEMTKIGREIKKIRLNPNTQKLITQEEIMTKKKIEKGKNEIIRKDFRALRRLARANTKRTNNINNQISSFKTIEMKSSNSLLDDSKLFQSKPSTRKKKKSTLNPLVTILFVGMSFKSWLKFTRLVQKDEIENDWNFQDDISSDDDMSHKSDSVFNEDEFNEEEQKEYDYKTNLPKKPKKNILEYEKSVDSGINDSGTDEEINKRNNDENNDRILVCDENYKNDQEKTLQKPILKNNKMSAFAALQENQFDNRISLKGKELEELKINNIASEEKDVIYSEGN